jgi:hypothetical protein
MKGLRLPQFTTKRKVDFNFNLFKPSETDRYGVILGRDFGQSLGIDVKNSTKTFSWDQVEVPMVQRNHWSEKAMKAYYQSRGYAKTNNDSKTIQEDVRASEILDAKYEKPNLDEIVTNQFHLSKNQKKLLRTLLTKHEGCFLGTKGKWKGKPIEVELKPDAVPFAGKPYKIPQAYMEVTKKEVERLCELGILSKLEGGSEWAAPSFVIPKKDNTVRFLTDFRKLNAQLKRAPFSLPHIRDIRESIISFMFATCLDLSMGYYSMLLSLLTRKFMVTVLPWGLYVYNVLPMGLIVASDVFQYAMSSLFQDKAEVVKIYMDDIIVLGQGTFEEHLADVDMVLQRLREMGMQVNPRKTEWMKDQVEYLGFTITREGIKPQSKKIDSILAIKTPTNQKDVRRFVGMVNFYKDLYKGRSKILAPLTALTGKGYKFKWGEEHQVAFDKMKVCLAQDTLVSFPAYGERFDVHTDASDLQVGGIVSQNNKPIGFFSRKFNAAQAKYPTPEQELLAIVETLKYFKNMLLGHKVRVYTDHKNLIFDNSSFSSDRVLRQRLVLEEYGAELVYIKGEKNAAADALSRLPTTEKELDDTNIEPRLEELMMQRRVYEGEANFPLVYDQISDSQAGDRTLRDWTQNGHPTKAFRQEQFGGHEIWTYRARNKEDDKFLIYIPEEKREEIVEWYHEMLQHPEAKKMELTMKQHFNWPGMSKAIENYCRSCTECQKFKITAQKKYGKIPPPQNWMDTSPWETVHVE